jgi:hypothetical protein
MAFVFKIFGGYIRMSDPQFKAYLRKIRLLLNNALQSEDENILNEKIKNIRDQITEDIEG